MSKAHVELFAELVGKDPALLAKLGLDKVNADAAAAAASAAAFLTNAVKEAKALGLEFTDEEFHAFMAAERTAAESGELSDTQLEGVAGGTSVQFPYEAAAVGITGDYCPLVRVAIMQPNLSYKICDVKVR